MLSKKLPLSWAFLAAAPKFQESTKVLAVMASPFVNFSPFFTLMVKCWPSLPSMDWASSLTALPLAS